MNLFRPSISGRCLYTAERRKEMDERVCESLVCGTSERVGRGAMGEADTEESEQRNGEEKHVGKGKG